MSTLGNRIRIAREFSGFTQTEMSEKIGIRQQYLQSAECGETAMPRKIKKIAEVLDVSLSWLMTGDGDMKPNKSEEDVKIISMIGRLTRKQKMEVVTIIDRFYQDNENVFNEVGYSFLAENNKENHRISA